MGFTVTTYREMIKLALKGIGALGQDEDPSADEEEDAMQILNDMLDSWNTKSLAVYTVQRQTFTMPSLKQTYTLGAGGDFNTTRPVRIEKAGIILSSDSQSELPLDVVNFDEWAIVTLKATTSTIAKIMWADYQYPLINCSFYPVPSAAQTVVLYTWQALAVAASLSTPLALPPGYRKAIRYNLMAELCPEYGREIDQVIAKNADTSLGDIKRINSQIRKATLRCDPAVLGGHAPFNYLTGR